jgi:hypothetical protein
LDASSEWILDQQQRLSKMNKPKHVWVVRAGDHNELADDVEEKSAVAIGWEDMGDLSDLTRREQYKER